MTVSQYLNSWCDPHPAPPTTVFVVYEVRQPSVPLLTTYDSVKAVNMMVEQSHRPPETGTYKVAAYRMVT